MKAFLFGAFMAFLVRPMDGGDKPVEEPLGEETGSDTPKK